MSEELPGERFKIDLSLVFKYNDLDNDSDQNEVEVALREKKRTLEQLKKLVGSDPMASFKVEKIGLYCPKLEYGILGIPLNWTTEHTLIVEITQFREGKHFLAIDRGPISPVSMFLVHFYARVVPEGWDGKTGFKNEVGDVMMTIDADGDLKSFEVLLKPRADVILGHSSGVSRTSPFKKRDDFVDLVIPGTPSVVVARSLETCNRVLRTLIQRGSLGFERYQ